MNTSGRRVGMLGMALFLLCVLSQAQAKEPVGKDGDKKKVKTEAVRGNSTFKLRINGFDRYYLVHQPPAYDGKTPLPVVVMFHDGGGNSRTAQFETGWNAKADKEVFLVVYPDALPPDTGRPANFRRNPQAWNDGSGRFYQGKVKVDDVGFINALLDDLAKRYKVDSRRIYATGFSNGASMAFRVGAALSRRFAAIAPVAGTCWVDRIKLKRMVPLCYITGTAGTLNQLAGGAPDAARKKSAGAEKKAPDKAPGMESVCRWGQALGCPDKPQSSSKEKGVRVETYAPCRDKSAMIYVSLEGLGNSWPGGRGSVSEGRAGKRAGRFKANDFIWEFFRQYELNSSPR